MIEIPPSGNITILASGGADSTILSYIFATIASDRSPRMVMMGVNETGTERIDAIREYIYQKTQYNYPLTTFKGKTHIRPTVEKILGVFGGTVYSGCNKVVEDQFYPTVHIKDDTPPVRGPALNEHHMRPFIQMDKIEVIRLYKDYGVIDLLHLTHSCGHSSIPCKGCYFCLERAWACSVLGIEDKYGYLNPYTQ